MKTTRLLNDIEKKRLSDFIDDHKENVNFKSYWKLIAISTLITILSIIHIYSYDNSDWSLISKLIVVVTPIFLFTFLREKFKNKRQLSSDKNTLKEILETGTIDIFNLTVQKIACLKEFEDESDIYLIGINENKSIYVYDDYYGHQNHKNFPSDHIDIYLDPLFQRVMDSKLFSKGKPTELQEIDGKSKWKYFEKHGFPEDLQIDKRKFETIIEEIKNEA